MAHLANPSQSSSGIWNAISNFVLTLWNTPRIQRDLDSRLAQMRKLQALSDSELAKHGIARDRIAHHVFRDIFYV